MYRKLWIATFLLSACPALHAQENIDPNQSGSQYSWGENAGWLSAEPGGEGGAGLLVSSSQIGGWIWAENIGWISLSCVNTSSCGTNAYKVVNDGNGNLSGFGWSENVGWINFAPVIAGVPAPVEIN